MTSNISENINHIYLHIYIYPYPYRMIDDHFHLPFVRRRWAWEMPITSWSIAGRSRIRARCRWLGTSGAGSGWDSRKMWWTSIRVNLITTSLISRALESWFLYGKSSPNGRTIQWIIMIYPDQWQHGHMLYKYAYNMNIMRDITDITLIW